MRFEVITQNFSKGAELPVADIWKKPCVAPMGINLLLKSAAHRITFFQTAISTYPDLEDQYLLYYKGKHITVRIHWYLGTGDTWNIKWYIDEVRARDIPDIEAALLSIAKYIGFPHKVAPNTVHPVRVLPRFGKAVGPGSFWVNIRRVRFPVR